MCAIFVTIPRGLEIQTPQSKGSANTSELQQTLVAVLPPAEHASQQCVTHKQEKVFTASANKSEPREKVQCAAYSWLKEGGVGGPSQMA